MLGCVQTGFKLQLGLAASIRAVRVRTSVSKLPGDCVQ